MSRDKIKIKFVIFICLAVGWLALTGVKTVEGATENKTIAEAEDRYVEITRQVTLTEVEDIKGLENEINNIPGVIVLGNSGSDSYLQYSLLIPRENFDESLDAVKQYGKVQSDSRSQRDITSEVTKLENSIISNEEHKQVIMDMIEKSQTIDTILEFEQYLMEVEIEQTNNQNQLYGLEDLSNYTSLELYIQTTGTDATYGEESFFSKLGTAFKSSFTGTLNVFEVVFVGLSYIIIPLIIVVVIAIIAFKLRKRGKNHEENIKK